MMDPRCVEGRADGLLCSNPKRCCPYRICVGITAQPGSLFRSRLPVLPKSRRSLHTFERTPPPPPPPPTHKSERRVITIDYVSFDHHGRLSSSTPVCLVIE